MLDVFEELYTLTHAVLKTEAQLQICEADVRCLQAKEDRATVDLARLGPVLKAKYADFAEQLEYSQKEVVTDKPNLLMTRLRLMKAMADQKDQIGVAWTKLTKLAPAYFNQCLAANFSEPWSLSENECQQLRPLLDVSRLDEETKVKLRSSRSRMLAIRSTQRRLEREIRDAPPVLPDALGIHLDSIRTMGFAKEIEGVQAEIRLLEDEIADRSGTLERLRRQAVIEMLGQQLRIAGRCQSESGSDVDQAWEDQASHVSTGDAPHDESETPIQAYYEIRRYLERTQEAIALYRMKRQSERWQASHIMTFSDSSSALLAARETTEVQEENEALLRAEQDVEDAKEWLLASGGEIPRSPSPEQKNPLRGAHSERSAEEPRGSDRGSRVSQYSGKIRKLNRRPLNTWRFRTQGAASISQMSKRSEYQLPSLRGRSLTGSFSITPERAEKREEYKAEQERIRAEQKRTRDEQEGM
ncbi:hypothetical protein TI39_contig4246g00003 [Zymoseptoria brevis]|uniref:Uncharacterized protein n=1 Tax=Zymoseptoria brevis TaxID=1047168 RepID=A0A0F4G8X2_9PEZI|nr:hypothetical protein TI39_contig4246g00003 [Zymoseptoria brevis]